VPSYSARAAYVVQQLRWLEPSPEPLLELDPWRRTPEPPPAPPSIVRRILADLG